MRAPPFHGSRPRGPCRRPDITPAGKRRLYYIASSAVFLHPPNIARWAMENRGKECAESEGALAGIALRAGSWHPSSAACSATHSRGTTISGPSAAACATVGLRNGACWRQSLIAPVVDGIVLCAGPWRPSSVAFTATHISGTPSLIAPVVDGLRFAQTRDMIARSHQTQFALLLLLAVSL